VSDIRIGSISLDCNDPQKLAKFWADLLEGNIAFSVEHFVAVKLDSMWITAVKVEDYSPPTWPENEIPKQMHLDLAVTDLTAASARAISLGATESPTQPSPDTYIVMLDPAGHPFCLTTQIPD
jgi:hypothetical protein